MRVLVLLGLLTCFLVWLERRFPRLPNGRSLSKSLNWERWVTNLSLYFLGVGIHRLVVPLFYMAWRLAHPQITWASPWSISLGVMVMDFFAYAVHRAHHAWEPLWHLHRVHHDDSQLDVATSYRSHPLQWLTIAGMELGLALLLQVPFEAVMLHGLLLPFFLVWHHAATDLPPAWERVVNRVFVTPSWHWVHHRDGEQRKNLHFGAIFSIWDRMSRKLYLAGSLALLAGLSFPACRESRKETPIETTPAMQEEIRYGKELIEHTARYLGPRGSGMKITQSRMNCQNCHLNGGRQPYAISLEAVHVRYPSYRAREGKVLTAADRINNCFERPMNGKPLPLDSREIKAIQAYFFSLAQGRAVGGVRIGDELNSIVRFPARAANPQRGAPLFKDHCVKCHGEDGQGKLTEDQVEFVYPPLWGPESFQAGSNMNRISKMASFIKANMPFGQATHLRPFLTDEQAFDVAAFVLDDRIHPRNKGRPSDFPKLDEKPIDYAIGPYVDGKSELEHKYGPFPPIIENLRKLGRPVSY